MSSEGPNASCIWHYVANPRKKKEFPYIEVIVEDIIFLGGDSSPIGRGSSNPEPYDQTLTGSRDPRLGRGYRRVPTHDGYACQNASRNLDERGVIAGKHPYPALDKHSRGVW